MLKYEERGRLKAPADGVIIVNDRDVYESSASEVRQFQDELLERLNRQCPGARLTSLRNYAMARVEIYVNGGHKHGDKPVEGKTRCAYCRSLILVDVPQCPSCGAPR